MIPAYYLVAMWVSFMSGAFVHHLTKQDATVEQATVYHVGVDYNGNVSSRCQEPSKLGEIEPYQGRYELR